MGLGLGCFRGAYIARPGKACEKGADMLGIGCSGSGSLSGSRHRDAAATREPRRILGGHLLEPPTDLTGRLEYFCYMYFY